MSELGKIFVLNFRQQTKLMYPVVYKNDNMFICKEHGTTGLKWFYHNETMDFNRYNENKERFIREAKDEKIRVYMTNKEIKKWKYTFTEIKDDPVGREIADLKQRVRTAEYELTDYKRQIENLNTFIKNNEQRIERYNKTIEKLEEERANKENENDP